MEKELIHYIIRKPYAIVKEKDAKDNCEQSKMLNWK